MFLRLVADSFTRRPKRKLLTMAALALGMAVATAALSVSLDVGDRLAQEFRSLGANLLVTPLADSLPLEIGGVDYRPVNAGAYLPEADLGKLKTIFWRFNIVGFAPILGVPGKFHLPNAPEGDPSKGVQLIGTWSNHTVPIPDGQIYNTGIEQTSPWWKVQGRWFLEGKRECVVGGALANRLGLKIGDRVLLNVDDPQTKVQRYDRFTVTGIVSTGDSEDQAIVMSLGELQQMARLPEVYRRLYVSALTKPEDAFARRDPK
jgi:putative ABC transport system permease protein